MTPFDKIYIFQYIGKTLQKGSSEEPFFPAPIEGCGKGEIPGIGNFRGAILGGKNGYFKIKNNSAKEVNFERAGNACLG
jgi:hypothetical protein